MDLRTPLLSTVEESTCTVRRRTTESSPKRGLMAGRGAQQLTAKKSEYDIVVEGGTNDVGGIDVEGGREDDLVGNRRRSSEQSSNDNIASLDHHPQLSSSSATPISPTTTATPTPPGVGASTTTPSLPWYSNPMQITAMISNFSTSYNVVNISLVLPIISEISATGRASEEDKAAVASSLLAGMIVGQLFGGALGDNPWLGRLGALNLVMLLQIVASLGSATCSDEEVYVELATWRFLLGVGAGGVYPLAAVLSAETNQSATNEPQQQQQQNHQVPSTAQITDNDNESDSEDDDDDEKEDESLHRVVLTFSMQGAGFIAVPIVAVFLLYTMPRLDIVWRVIVGLGSVPGIMLMMMQWHLYRRKKFGRQQRHHIIIPTTTISEGVVDDHESYVPPTTTTNNTSPTIPNESSSATQSQTTNSPADGNVVVHEHFETTMQESEHNIISSDNDSDDSSESQNDGVFRDDDGDGAVAVVRQHHRYHGWFDAIRREGHLIQKLLGTAFTWFLFDVLFYGNTLFQPIVIEAAFGAREQASNPIHVLRQTALDSLLLTSIALPGYAVAGLTLGNSKRCSQTPRFVMLQGFAIMSILYLAVGLSWNGLRNFPIILVLLYSLTFFFANYGPNTTTFVLPSIVFSPECRSTFNGISAAAGKLGALTGATLFSPAADALGDAAVMIICSGVALVAFVMTKLFVKIKHHHEQ